MHLLFTILAAVLAAFPPPSGVPVPFPAASSNTPPDGITVRGYGNAETQADTATVTLQLYARNGGSIDEATVAAVVDALVRAGVARSGITTPPFLSGAAQTANASVIATVSNPTTAMIQNGVAALAASFPSGSKVTLGGAQVRLSAANCAAVRVQAQTAAIRQARASADSIAHTLGVGVGKVLAVDYSGNGFESGGNCVFNYSLGPYGNPPFSDPQEYLRVRVSSTVTIRYAIR